LASVDLARNLRPKIHGELLTKIISNFRKDVGYFPFSPPAYKVFSVIYLLVCMSVLWTSEERFIDCMSVINCY